MPSTPSRSRTNSAIGDDYLVHAQASRGGDGNGEQYPRLTGLLTLRQSQGHRVLAVNQTDINDEFAFGLATPAAIKDYLA